MPRTPSHEPPLAGSPGEPWFDTAAIYALAGGLRVRSYEDLLAPHWAVADCASPGPGLALPLVERAHCRTHVMIALPAAPRDPGCEGDLSVESARAIAIVPVPPDPRSTPTAPKSPAVLAGRDAREQRWVHRLRAAAHAALRSLGTRSALWLRTWRSVLAGRWPARRPRA